LLAPTFSKRSPESKELLIGNAPSNINTRFSEKAALSGDSLYAFEHLLREDVAVTFTSLTASSAEEMTRFLKDGDPLPSDGPYGGLSTTQVLKQDDLIAFLELGRRLFFLVGHGSSSPVKT